MIVTYQSRQVEGKPVDFLTRKEDFSEYQLADGKIHRIKMVVTRIIRLEGETEQIETGTLFEISIYSNQAARTSESSGTNSKTSRIWNINSNAP
jgi:hypothetical protein